MIKPLIAVVILAAIVVGIATWRRSPRQAVVDPVPFRVGQEWGFRGRSVDPNPTVVVLKLEGLPSGEQVVHVSVSGVRIKNPHVSGGYSATLPHLPISPAALQQSVTQLLRDAVALPAFEEGYQEWRRAEGGVFTIPLAQVLDLVEHGIK